MSVLNSFLDMFTHIGSESVWLIVGSLILLTIIVVVLMQMYKTSKQSFTPAKNESSNALTPGLQSFLNMSYKEVNNENKYT